MIGRTLIEQTWMSCFIKCSSGVKTNNSGNSIFWRGEWFIRDIDSAVDFCWKPFCWSLMNCTFKFSPRLVEKDINTPRYRSYNRFGWEVLKRIWCSIYAKKFYWVEESWDCAILYRMRFKYKCQRRFTWRKFSIEANLG